MSTSNFKLEATLSKTNIEHKQRSTQNHARITTNPQKTTIATVASTQLRQLRASQSQQVTICSHNKITKTKCLRGHDEIGRVRYPIVVTLPDPSLLLWPVKPDVLRPVIVHRDEMTHGHTTTAIHEMSTPPFQRSASKGMRDRWSKDYGKQQMSTLPLPPPPAPRPPSPPRESWWKPLFAFRPQVGGLAENCAREECDGIGRICERKHSVNNGQYENVTICKNENMERTHFHIHFQLPIFQFQSRFQSHLRLELLFQPS